MRIWRYIPAVALCLALAGCAIPGEREKADLIRRAQPTVEELRLRREQLEEEGRKMDRLQPRIIEQYSNQGCVSRELIYNP